LAELIRWAGLFWLGAQLQPNSWIANHSLPLATVAQSAAAGWLAGLLQPSQSIPTEQAEKREHMLRSRTMVKQGGIRNLVFYIFV